jgi:RNA polymerase sigma factor (sigma-70 family)
VRVLSADEVHRALEDADWLGRERECLARARQGDREAFAELYHAFARALYARVLMPRLGNPAAAEEALGETFRTALERLGDFDDRGRSVWFWLARIAANKAADQHRARARTGRALQSYARLCAVGAGDGDGEATPPASAREAEELRAAVGRVLERLHPRYRRAIELRFFEEQSRAACAQALAVQVSTFDVVLLRALRSFRAAWLEEIGHER